jgi:hypothetical protein
MPLSHNDFLLLPLAFDTNKLLEDLVICEQRNWVSHYNTNDFNGDWKAISLRSSNGEMHNVLAHEADHYSNTPLLSHCSYFQFIINSFDCDLETVRLLALAPGSTIRSHKDRGLSYSQGSFRLHIPIITDDKVDFMVNNHLLHMKAGECWYANFDLPHSVLHKGENRRIHLVIDGKRNAWTDSLFENAGYNFELEKEESKLDVHTVREMIAHLSAMNTETSLKMVEDLRQKYGI